MINFLKNLFTRNYENPAVPLTADEIFGSVVTSSGVRVNPETALANPAVWRGVNLVANSVAKLPISVYRNDPEEGQLVAESHPAHYLLNTQPHELYTPFRFKQTLVAQALLWGNAYAWIVRDEQARPTELFLLDPGATNLDKYDAQYRYRTTISSGNTFTSFIFPQADVFHLRGLTPDGLIGWYVCHVLKEALGHGLSLQKYGNVYFRNGGKPSVVIELPPNVRDVDKVEQFRRMWGSIHQGIENSSKPAFIAPGSKVTPLATSNDEGQYIQSRQHDLIMVADVLGVPPHKLGSGIQTSYSSLEAENKAFLSDCLDPWLVAFEEEANVKLLSERQKYRATHYVQFDRKSLTATDARTESELLISDLNNGVRSWKEIRQALNLSTEKELEDEWRRPANIVVEAEEPEEPEPVMNPLDPSVEPVEPMDDPLQDAPEQEAPEDTPREPQEAARALSRGIIQRFLTRCEKAVASGKYDLRSHQELLADHLCGIDNGPEFAKALVDDLMSQLEQVVPEGRTDIFKRVQIEELVEALWN